uniref:Uncharacterized protein MANES_08G024800 n=2 Tax=Rhizophora mucronata TaxID=61149 RepID=A0A2P2IPX1_RHIMU
MILRSWIARATFLLEELGDFHKTTFSKRGRSPIYPKGGVSWCKLGCLH